LLTYRGALGKIIHLKKSLKFSPPAKNFAFKNFSFCLKTFTLQVQPEDVQSLQSQNSNFWGKLKIKTKQQNAFALVDKSQAEDLEVSKINWRCLTLL